MSSMAWQQPSSGQAFQGHLHGDWPEVRRAGLQAWSWVQDWQKGAQRQCELRKRVQRLVRCCQVAGTCGAAGNDESANSCRAPVVVHGIWRGIPPAALTGLTALPLLYGTPASPQREHSPRLLPARWR